jgi:hypothetical protein
VKTLGILKPQTFQFIGHGDWRNQQANLVTALQFERRLRVRFEARDS